MPRGCQWTSDDWYNARRYADIQAEAMRQMLRRENFRRQPAPEPQVVEKVVYVEAPPQRTPEELAAIREKARRDHEQWLAEQHAKWALEAEYGSESYIRHRYYFSWSQIIEEYRRKYKCSAPQARQIIAWHYTEESFERYEDERIEKAMGHRDYGNSMP